MKKLILTITLILGSTTSFADTTNPPSIVIDCTAVSAASPIKRATVISDKGYTLELRNSEDQIVLQTDVFYGDDMDAVYYYSEKEDLILEYDWSQMHQTHESESLLTLNFYSENKPRQNIRFICKEN